MKLLHGKNWLLALLFLLVYNIPLFAFQFNPIPTKEPGLEAYTIEEFSEFLNRRIPTLMRTYQVPGVLAALIREGEVIWSSAYGYARLEEGIPMTTNAPCRVESISKSVTAWGVLKLVEEGKLELDRPVVDYLPSWQFPESDFDATKITARQLLSNSSGLPLGALSVRYPPGASMPGLKEGLTEEAVLQQEPGTAFIYSNTGFHLLELLIEEVSGQDFADYMQKEILLPLGMQDASFNWQTDFEGKIPYGYDLDQQPVPPYVYPEQASGGLFATLSDITAFVLAGMPDYTDQADPVLSKNSIDQLYTPVIEINGFYGLAFEAYGLGYFLETLASGKKAVSHGGQGTGWMTHFHAVPATGDGIVILTNSQRSWPFFSNLLNDWTAWNGFSSLGMGRIAGATRGVWLLIALLLLVAVSQLGNLGRAFARRTRTFAPLSAKARPWRTVLAITFLLLSSLLVWAMNQDYLFFYSIFPTAILPLGLAISLFALTALLFALFPKTESS